ncbi:cytochrome P450 [Planktotalea frisia]|uniref:Epi-isozizaene 5-monooxygenase/(E)-beta-farnesene synthase n=1 Tax=Planktotalea frisia TaxID=696762 RepID=A0A1L9NUS8_9RHOB|nr:cytochrome P450 [Planktotalea frisia]OJI93009.1 Epi-isozizaene 5-monooxygenase/(E)-beta-farnesene synthase [Planktotalea frisia]PZX34813.1 cytochrome P450 [Planktotalea frisia]
MRQYAKLFRKDILSAQPARLYRAWMAEFRTPFFSSYLINQPELVKLVLKERPDDFPKSGRVSEGLRPLLGDGVFLTNGEVWKRQRRIIDPAFEGGRLRETFPSMWAAAEGAVKRLEASVGQEIEVEQHTSHATADVIFRTLFSIPIENEIAAEMFREFHRYQRSQPLLNLAAVLPLPRWMPRFFRSATRRSAAKIRAAITQLTTDRHAQIEAGTAPDDLATKIMTTADPLSGEKFTAEEMVDQVSIFFLAGHETSASALAWALYLMAMFPEWQDKVAAEAKAGLVEEFSAISKLRISRDVFREALRLYPPVPMMVRQNTCPEEFRKREVRTGSQVVVSAWHLHRHERLWDNPDGFDPDRWGTENGKTCMRDAYVPFSAGSRVCPGAGFALIEGVLLLSMILKNYRVSLTDRPAPEPVAHLTVRSKDGIYLKLDAR